MKRKGGRSGSEWANESGKRGLCGQGIRVSGKKKKRKRLHGKDKTRRKTKRAKKAERARRRETLS